MSIFGAITTFAATSITTALLDSNKQQKQAQAQVQAHQPNALSHDDGFNDQTNNRTVRHRGQITAPHPRITELPASPTTSKPTSKVYRDSSGNSGNSGGGGGGVKQKVMQPTGLPQNSIWATMSYPIPRGPCLQKSSLISGCSCQRFMVHPLKATTSFDCDGCGHHASFHKMKSGEEEVENAARFRESLLSVGVAVEGDGGGDVGRRRGRAVGLLKGNGEEEDDDDGEDDETLDEDHGGFVEPERKKRVLPRKAVLPAPRTGSARAPKRKRELVPID